MPTELYAVADSHIYIGGVLPPQAADFVAADYASQTWVEVDGWETMGDIGDTAELISTAVINRGRMTKQKGVRNGGSYEASFVRLGTDAGQLALKAAEAVASSYAFKIVYSTGETEYFIALVMGAMRNGGDANTVLKLSSTLEINSNIVEVAAP